MKATAPGGCFPTPDQELLLKAALSDGDEARKAYAAWRAVVNLDAPDAGTFRLLPLLAKNLKQLGIRDAQVPIFHGIYRMTWAKNQVLLRELSEILSRLQQANVPTLVLKGAALLSLYYRDLGARPMSDVDVLVPSENACTAVQTLLAAGLIAKTTPLEGARAQRLLSRLGAAPKRRQAPQCSSVFMRVRHGHGFERAEKLELDLHWRISERVFSVEIDNQVWRRAVPLVIAGAQTLAMDATDQLLHVIAHGVRWNIVPPWRWVADAALILSSPNTQIDWPRLVHDAHTRGAVLEVSAGLQLLARLLALPIPSSIFSELAAQKTPPVARYVHHLRTRPTGILAGVHELSYLAARYAEMAGRPEYPEACRGPLYFLKHVLGIDALWQLGVYTAVEIARRGHQTLSGITAPPVAPPSS